MVHVREEGQLEPSRVEFGRGGWGRWRGDVED